MKDPYAIENPADRRGAVPPPPAPTRSRPLWAWVLLVVGLLVNVAGSAGTLPLAVGVTGGVTALGGIVGLVTARRSRR
ncbi:hypothetical protein FHR75_004357 [Kineococcus radiotolerans]|uniref:Uncharacterized protein n=1 Tax=Kineococcus radiotolerans TaxID=131568 RepID=A0A7W4TR05_KINRA|nr:DUF3040 domain-containing protein [Kineococcus radiotolerans]MBB2903515.1 hypothetical protein [Kineococcus radiotolerans]